MLDVQVELDFLAHLGFTGLGNCAVGSPRHPFRRGVPVLHEEPHLGIQTVALNRWKTSKEKSSRKITTKTTKKLINHCIRSSLRRTFLQHERPQHAVQPAAEYDLRSARLRRLYRKSEGILGFNVYIHMSISNCNLLIQKSH